MSYHIQISGPFKPYVRMTQRGKWTSQAAQEYLSSKMAMQLQLKAEMVDRPMLPGQTPLRVLITITHAGGFHHRDLDNEVKAILDAMQGIVFPDDRWIDILWVYRRKGDQDLIDIYAAGC